MKTDMSEKDALSMQIANTILKQLGGHKFVVMTGSKQMYATDNGLYMELSKNISGANRLTITLESDDTYTLRFSKHTRGHFTKQYVWVDENIKDIKEYSGVYCDQLADIFEDVTGLYTKLIIRGIHHETYHRCSETQNVSDTGGSIRID